ncbi:MAG: carboxypeptidase regulatory-like domain-containing protein [Candidatus Electryonea clarkiae]|nr:carboxypeptidase regulatory-like domain-containing protein [Candidatus Electryonea clarkiae]MDP8286393.1 carboxypeptidase regulatory-like domain-containing protein [Candidatus Electryonea clarkiae]
MHRFKFIVVFSLTLAIATNGLLFAYPASDDVSAWPVVRTASRFSELDEPYVLIFQDQNPWNNSHQEILEGLDVDFDVVNSTAMATHELDEYTVIMFPSTQGQTYYDRFEAQWDRFEEWVEAGGWIEFHGCTQGATWELWDGTNYVHQGSGTNYVEEPDHPMVEGVDEEFTGGSANHGWIDDIPDDALVIITDPDDRPVLIEYSYGNGNMIVTSETWEYGYNANQQAGQVMENAINYSTEEAPGIGEGDASMEGYVYDSVTDEEVEGAIVRAGAPRDTTDEDGYYSLEGVISGEDRTVRIQKEHYYTTTVEIDIDPGDDNEFDFEITPLATMTGIITDSETEDVIEGAIITWADHVDTTDEEGVYLLIDIHTETDTLVIEAEGYFDYEDTEYEIPDGDNEVDFEIDILSADLTGIVTDELTEEALFGAAVTVVNSETGDIYREVVTDETGAYNAPALHDGVTYEVSVTLDGYAPSDVEDVLIRWNRDNEQDFELTPIFELGIRQLQQEQDVETWVLTSGIVTQGSNVTDTEQTIMYIQDDSGWGIMLWDEDPWDPENNINRGDGVTVIGFLDEIDDMTRITNFEIEVNSNDNALPEPRVETTGDMSGNSQREGTWGQISGQINRDPPGEGTYSLIVNDGSGQCEVQIVETTGIDLSELSADDWGTFTGVISLSRQGLRLIPNMQDDVTRIPVDPPSDLTSEQEVVPGEPLQLEVTLSWAHDHLDEWLRFKIYRDGEHIGNTQQNTWSEKIEDPMPGEFASYTYEYGVTAVYDEGETDATEIEVIWDITQVQERLYSGVPTEWALEAVYPNPFNPTLHVVLGVPQVSNVTVEIMDILGRRVTVLHQGELNASYHRVGWNATGHPTGLYFLRVTSNTGFNKISKVMFIK